MIIRGSPVSCAIGRLTYRTLPASWTKAGIDHMAYVAPLRRWRLEGF